MDIKTSKLTRLPTYRHNVWQRPATFRKLPRIPLDHCRVTNSEEEMKDPAHPYAYDSDMINLGPQYQIPNPELGPLELRVEKTYVEALFSEEINMDDTNYWFSEPEGGWNSKDLYAIQLEETNPEPITAAHFAPGRTELGELEEGAVMTGVVVCIMYYHGVQVDLGAQYDGLIPVRQEEWMDDHFRAKFGACTGVAEDFEIGQQVTVKIHKINHRHRCRWPIQLVVLDPDVQHKLTPPDEWLPPFDLRGVRSYDEAFEITGRPKPEGVSAEVGYLKYDEIFDKQLTLKSKELAGMDYGQREVSFEGLKLSTDIFERLRASQWQAADNSVADMRDDEESYEEDFSSPR